jgi:hypothetical protein
MKGDRAFRDWFVARYGPPPKKTHAVAFRQWLAAKYALEEAERWLEDARSYEERREAALTAWRAQRHPPEPSR